MSDVNPAGGGTPTGPQPSIPQGLTNHIVEQNGQFLLRSVVDGTETLIPIDVATAQLQKSGAADRRLEEAGRILKENKTAVDFYKNTIAGLNGDDDAAQRAAAMIGLDLEDNAAPAQNPPSEIRSAAPDPDTAEMMATWKQLKSAGVNPRDIFLLMAAQARDSVEQNDRSEVSRVVLGNAEFAALTKGRSKDASDLLMDEVYGSFRQAVNQGAPEGPATIVAAVKKTVQKYKTLGISPSATPGARGIPGLGPTPGNPVTGTGAFDGDKRPDAVTPFGKKRGEYARNLAARLTYDLSQRSSEAGLSV